MRAGPLTLPVVDTWLRDLEARHLADLRIPEVTRALRALSSAYVERRHVVGSGRTLDSAGKRAAFALFYAPLHFLIVSQIVRALGLHEPEPSSILDLGCGTGVAGGAWALEAGGHARVLGLDRHPWSVEESRWTYRSLGLAGHAKQVNLERPVALHGHDAVVAAYTLNELPAASRESLIDRLLEAAASGHRVLVLEPVSRAVAPWWAGTAARVVAAGGRADEWRLTLDRPALVETLDRAAGLHHQEVGVRTLVMRPTDSAISPGSSEKPGKRQAYDRNSRQRQAAGADQSGSR